MKLKKNKYLRVVRVEQCNRLQASTENNFLPREIEHSRIGEIPNLSQGTISGIHTRLLFM